MAIRHAVFDFDGSCTRVPGISDRFLAAYGKGLARLEARIAGEWAAALEQVRKRSPEAGWMLGGKASAPAAADPYILAYEAARDLAAKFGLGELPDDLHGPAYDEAQAEFRPDLTHVLDELVQRGVRIAFISNSSTARIAARLDEHLANKPGLRAQIRVLGDAAKFRVREITPSADVPPAIAGRFDAVPVTVTLAGLARPVYLRRGAYLEALCKVWDGDVEAIEQTIVCGDIWELDLALPAAMGMQVHLIERGAPYCTYPYERQAATGLGPLGGVSAELTGLLGRIVA